MDGKENVQRDTETVDKEDGNKSDGGCSYKEDGSSATGDGTPQQKDEEMDCRTPAPLPPPPIIIPAPAPAAPAIPNGVDGYVLIDEIHTLWSMYLREEKGFSSSTAQSRAKKAMQLFKDVEAEIVKSVPPGPKIKAEDRKTFAAFLKEHVRTWLSVLGTKPQSQRVRGGLNDISSLLYEYYLGKEDAAYLQVVKALEASSAEETAKKVTKADSKKRPTSDRHTAKKGKTGKKVKAE